MLSIGIAEPCFPPLVQASSYVVVYKGKRNDGIDILWLHRLPHYLRDTHFHFNQQVSFGPVALSA